MANPNNYSGNHPDEDRGAFDSAEAHRFIRSRTPEERKSEREAKRQATNKGMDGIVTKDQLVGNDGSIPDPGGAAGPFLPVLFGCCTNGQAGFVTVWCQSVPSPL